MRDELGRELERRVALRRRHRLLKEEINELVDDGVALLKLGLKGQFLQQDIKYLLS